MKNKYLFAGLFAASLILALIVLHLSSIVGPVDDPMKLYFGVDIAYADIDKIKALIDEVSPYTNMFIVGSTGVTHDETRLAEIIQYLVDHDLSYVVFTNFAFRLSSINSSVASSQDYFLGIYYDDEPAGRQLDLHSHRIVLDAENYSDAATQFIYSISYRLNATIYQNRSENFIPPSEFTLFTSDYALYWFDYKAGYDVILAQFGWNYSRQLNIALCRGAAKVQDKDWGVIVVWTYTHPPYLGSGEALFNDLVLAYENGAKYILVFDSNEDYTDTILDKEHLDALKRFWDYAKNNPRSSSLLSGRVAFVLPKDYGYGFRGPYDKIWGLWEGDALSYEISERLGVLLKEYGSKLDVIYDDCLKLDNTYEAYFFWNGTSYTP